MWQQQNKVGEARELLEEIYSWFTEGFDTKDLREAEALLVTLGGRVKTERKHESSVKRPALRVKTCLKSKACPACASAAGTGEPSRRG